MYLNIFKNIYNFIINSFSSEKRHTTLFVFFIILSIWNFIVFSVTRQNIDIILGITAFIVSMSFLYQARKQNKIEND